MRAGAAARSSARGDCLGDGRAFGALKLRKRSLIALSSGRSALTSRPLSLGISKKSAPIVAGSNLACTQTMGTAPVRMRCMRPQGRAGGRKRTGDAVPVVCPSAGCRGKFGATDVGPFEAAGRARGADCDRRGGEGESTGLGMRAIGVANLSKTDGEAGDLRGCGGGGVLGCRGCGGVLGCRGCIEEALCGECERCPRCADRDR